MVKILHITNTDVFADSRIRKELISLSELTDISIFSIGIPDDNKGGTMQLDGTQYLKLDIKSRVLRFLPRPICYLIELMEFTTKAVIKGRTINPDVVHCHDTFALPAGWVLKKKIGCQLIYDAHELESQKNGQNAILSFSTLAIEMCCWKQIDFLISVSNSIINWYLMQFGNKPNALILNSPIIAKTRSPSTEILDTPRTYFHEKYHIPKDHLVFVYLGILGPGRGIEICLNAFAFGPRHTHVIFIGFGPLEALIVNHSRSYNNIHFHPSVPHDQVVPLARNADYGLCLIENASLSDYYSLPNKLFEYCFANLPIVASDFPEIQQFIAQYSSGQCCKPTLDSLRALLSRIGKPHIKTLSYTLSEICWETQANRLLEIYQNLLAGRP